MASGAGVGDLVFIGHGRCDEGKSVGAYFDVGDGRGDFGHVAGDTTAAGGAFLMVGVLFEGGGAGAVQRERAMAIEAKLVGGFPELRVVIRAVDVMTTEAGDAAAIHDTLDKVIALHAVLVSGAVGVMRERCLPERMLFQLPEIPQI